MNKSMKNVIEIVLLIVSFGLMFGGFAILWRGVTAGAVIAGLYMITFGMAGMYGILEKK